MQQIPEMRRLLKTYFSQAIYRDQGKMALIDTSVERRLRNTPSPCPPPRSAEDVQEAATTCKNSARHEKPAGPLGSLLPALIPPARPAGDECFGARRWGDKKKITLQQQEQRPGDSESPGEGDQLARGEGSWSKTLRFGMTLYHS